MPIDDFDVLMDEFNDTDYAKCPYCGQVNEIPYDCFIVGRNPNNLYTDTVFCCNCNAPMTVTVYIDFHVTDVKKFTGIKKNQKQLT